MGNKVNVAELIGSQRFGAFQLRIVILCGMIQFLDGFDTQAMGYAGPALRAAWHIRAAGIGFGVRVWRIWHGRRFDIAGTARRCFWAPEAHDRVRRDYSAR